MGKKRDETIDTGEAESLTHNPFAALAGASATAAPQPEPGPEADGGSAAEEPRFPDKVVVRREKKGRGGKTVTRISGLPASHREALMGRMRKALGCGATLEGEDVVLLGSLVDRAADWIEGLGAKRVSRSS